MKIFVPITVICWIMLLYLPKSVVAQTTANTTGPNSSQSPYLLPSYQGANFTSIITAGDIAGGYKMVGIPDGLGAFDNGDGTFTVLMNHELNDTAGVVRAHGSKGAFVSKWVIKKSDLSVVSGSDLIKKINLWNPVTLCYNEFSFSVHSPLAAFKRFCSGDLPAVAAFYNSVTGLGTKERIFMNGEEAGTEGRAFGHIVTGPNAGRSYELPALGKFSIENLVANPATGNKTVVAGMDDATPGQVYFYIGTKKSAGTEIEKAGLCNGKLYSPVVTGLSIETSEPLPVTSTTFSMQDLDSVKNLTGADLQAKSIAAGVTQFLRPEDGAWDPSNPNDFYFNTTNSFGSPSRLWKLHFTNINDLTEGGTITAVLDGTEGQQMLDNLTIDNNGHILLQEDVGNNERLGKIWQYDIAADKLTEVAAHDASRFLTGGINFLTQDEESSGIIDVQNILGPGMFLLTDQAHYPIAGEVVEGGQLLAFYNPGFINKAPVVNIINPVAGNAYNAGNDINFQVQAADSDGTISKVEFYSGGNKLGEAAAAPYIYIGKTVEAGNYVLTAKATDNSGATAMSAPVIIDVSACNGSGSISAEGYINIPGQLVSDLMNNPAFPDKPDVKVSLDIFEYGNHLANNQYGINNYSDGQYGADHYGARVGGYICAPVTGYYTFYISGDDQAGLWLSTNDNPANKVLIAYAESWTDVRQWNKFSSQKSAPVRLVKGAKYYIETLHKELVGPDHISVGWTLPGGVFEAPIPGSRLSPWNYATGTTSGFRGMSFSTAMVNISVANNNLNTLRVSALPNPSTSYFTLITSSNNEKTLTVIVTEITGRIVETRINIPANGTLRIGNKLHAGMYIVEVIQGDKRQMLKLIKQ